MQQLSLFDFDSESVQPEKPKKTPPAKKQPKNTAESTAVDKEVTLFEVEAAKDATTTDNVVPAAPIEEAVPEIQKDIIPENSLINDEVEKENTVPDALVFSDNQIRVKLKLPLAKENIETAQPAAVEPDVPAIADIDKVAVAQTKQPQEKGTVAYVKKRGRKSFKEMDAEVDLIDVPADELLFKKQYYPISVVAKWFRVNNSLLRFWENKFTILKPKKNKKGDRFFRPEDVKNLQVIYYLLRQKKLTINGAVKHLKAHKENTEVNLQIIRSLNNFKGFLLELKANAERQ